MRESFGLYRDCWFRDEMGFHFLAHAHLDFGREFIQVVAVAAHEHEEFRVRMNMRLVRCRGEPVRRFFHAFIGHVEFKADSVDVRYVAAVCVRVLGAIMPRSV